MQVYNYLFQSSWIVWVFECTSSDTILKSTAKTTVNPIPIQYLYDSGL